MGAFGSHNAHPRAWFGRFYFGRFGPVSACFRGDFGTEYGTGRRTRTGKTRRAVGLSMRPRLTPGRQDPQPPTAAPAVSNSRNKSNNGNTILEHLQQPPGVEADTFDAGPMRSRTWTARRRRILRGTPTAAPVPGDRRSRGELAPTGWPDVPAAFASVGRRFVCFRWLYLAVIYGTPRISPVLADFRHFRRKYEGLPQRNENARIWAVFALVSKIGVVFGIRRG